MSINLSIPIVCYLGDFLPKDNSTLSKQKISLIYSKTSDFIGHREIRYSGSFITEFTYNTSGVEVSKATITSLETGAITVDIYRHLTKTAYSKFYLFIEASLIECTTSQVGHGMIASETLTASPIDNITNDWAGAFMHSSWYCFLKDADHNEIGHREIYYSSEFSDINTSYDVKENSQFECLREFDREDLNQYGSLKRFINHCKIIDTSPKQNMTSSGIILDIGSNLEFHKTEAKKLKN